MLALFVNTAQGVLTCKNTYTM